MRLRPPVGADAASTRDPSSDATNTASSTGAMRTLLLVAVGAAAVAYAVSRLRSSGDADADVDADVDVDASLETVRDRTAAALPSAVGDRVAEVVPAEPQSIPIGGRGSDEREADAESDGSSESGGSETDDDTAAPDVGDVGDPIDDAEVDADLADEPSSTKISSGSSDEIQDKPAEPGEMTVEDDVEELAGEADDDADDASDADEE